MGEVYRARDPRLNRAVAIKVSAARFSARFEREAQAIAALNHPHICQVYDIGPDYLVMEFIEGAQLAGPLNPHAALHYAVQIADALAAAHSKGITHRDLKPANILVTASGIKLLDFGLALLSHSDSESDETVSLALTQPGTVLGTAAYMSPEQAEAKAVDARSDIFSFGLVLYEMLSGRRAFSGDSAIAVMAAILQKEPAPLPLPPALQHVLERCLRKSPADRFQSMPQVKEALLAASGAMGWLGAMGSSGAMGASGAIGSPGAVGSSGAMGWPGAMGPPGAAPLPPPETRGLPPVAAPSIAVLPPGATPSIAVLPFASMSGGQDDEYFSDGLAEEIINALTQVPGLKVIARTSAFAFKGKNEDIRKIAETLGVSSVLEGSVRRAGPRLRVTAQLIRAEDGSHLWSQRYESQMTDVFAIQDEISAAIVQQLRINLTGQFLVKRAVTNIAAYDATLEGRHHLTKYTPASNDRGRQCFERAIALDPQYAPAYAGLAEYHVQQAGIGFAGPLHALPLARQAVLAALELDPLLPEAHAIAGHIAAELDYDWNASEQHYLRAVASNPAAAAVRYSYAYWCLRPTGRIAEALAEIERALELDPLSLPYGVSRAYLLSFAGRYAEAANVAKACFDIDPNFSMAQLTLSYL
jgi:serine/threonine-protein kinase